MIKYDRYKDVPHFELICENGELTIPSIFMFEMGAKELFPFLHVCNEYNCTVVFENEEITVLPNENNALQHMLLAMYAHIAEHPKIANDYIRYLSKLEKMDWVQSEHEPILKQKEQ